MATVSARIDDKTKSDAEKIADEIGITLSTAINIFIKQFITNRGFPFSVVATPKEAIIDVEALDNSIKKAISDPNNLGIPKQFTYLDPDTNKPITVTMED